MAVINMLPQAVGNAHFLEKLITITGNSFDKCELHGDVLEIEKTTSGEKNVTITNTSDTPLPLRYIFTQNGWNGYSANIFGNTGNNGNSTYTLGVGESVTLTARGTAQYSSAYFRCFVINTKL